MGCCCCCRNVESCGQTCDVFCPCISIYPSLCTVFLTLISAGLITAIFSAYAFISYRLSIFQLFQWTITWYLIIHSSFLGVVTVIPLVILALIIWATCSTRRRASCYKLLLILIIIFTVILLATCMVCSILIIYGGSEKSSFFSRQIELVWMKELHPSLDSTLPCRVQFQLKCRGLEQGDCTTGSTTANFSRCATICRPQDSDGKAKFDNVIYAGCRERIAGFFIRWHAILLAGTAIACVLTLIALFVCCTISFERDSK